MNSLLVITGSMGSGKTSVLGEASDLLAQRRIVHAAIDVDALGLSFPPEPAAADDAMYRNLRSVCENYAALGIRRFMLARAIEKRAQLDVCREAVSPAGSPAHTVVCRLTASPETMRHRVRIRETGIAQSEYAARVASLDAILDDARLEDFTVTNENRTVTDVALEMLVKAGWILD